MIERQIPKNIESFKPKFIGPFTLRQFVCLFIAAAIALPVWYILDIKLNLIREFSVGVAGICAVPALACGWWEPFGLGIPAEKFLKNYIRDAICLPFFRPYQTELSEHDLTKDVTLTKKEQKERAAIEKSGEFKKYY